MAKPTAQRKSRRRGSRRAGRLSRRRFSFPRGSFWWPLTSAGLARAMSQSRSTAPVGTNDLPKYDGGSWINILKVENLVITGSGTIDGQGTNVYTKDPEAQAFPNSLVLDFVKNGTVSGITLLNSKFFHINIYKSEDVKVENLTITAPGNSPNTDGIHIGDSKATSTPRVRLSAPEMTASPSRGSSALELPVTRGPGQVSLRAALAASNLTFENIKMEDVANPIIIDQNYCPEKVCTAKSKSKSAVTVKDVIFRNITAHRPPVGVSTLLDKQPCSGADHRRQCGVQEEQQDYRVCNAKGTAKDTLQALACLA
ncbi:hypothetical protein ZWY2020_051030 [Hordeum vulgare]|nr:hypothetical protein ZWY2020_051030 [Hordeum vulgare]